MERFAYLTFVVIPPLGKEQVPRVSGDRAPNKGHLHLSRYPSVGLELGRRGNKSPHILTIISS